MSSVPKVVTRRPNASNQQKVTPPPNHTQPPLRSVAAGRGERASSVSVAKRTVPVANVVDPPLSTSSTHKGDIDGKPTLPSPAVVRPVHLATKPAPLPLSRPSGSSSLPSAQRLGVVVPPAEASPRTEQYPLSPSSVSLTRAHVPPSARSAREPQSARGAVSNVTSPPVSADSKLSSPESSRPSSRSVSPSVIEPHLSAPAPAPAPLQHVARAPESQSLPSTSSSEELDSGCSSCVDSGVDTPYSLLSPAPSPAKASNISEESSKEEDDEELRHGITRMSASVTSSAKPAPSPPLSTPAASVTVPATATRSLSISSASTSTAASTSAGPRTLMVESNGTPQGASSLHFRTVREAVRQSRDDDTVLIKPGVYSEAMEVDVDRCITIQGAGDLCSEVIIQQNSGFGSVLGCRSQKGCIRNVTLRPQESAGVGGLTVSRGDWLIESCDISASSDKVALFISGGNVRIRNSLIHEGETGVYVSGGNCAGALEGCDIYDCFDGIYVGDGAHPDIKHNRVHDMRNSGIQVSFAKQHTIDGNDIWGCANKDLQVDDFSATRVLENRFRKPDHYTQPAPQKASSPKGTAAGTGAGTGAANQTWEKKRQQVINRIREGTGTPHEFEGLSTPVSAASTPRTTLPVSSGSLANFAAGLHKPKWDALLPEMMSQIRSVSPAVPTNATPVNALTEAAGSGSQAGTHVLRVDSHAEAGDTLVFRTLRDCLRASVDGDTIQVSPGVYQDALGLDLDRCVNIVGLGPRDQVILEHTGFFGSVVTLKAGHGGIKNITLRPSMKGGKGIGGVLAMHGEWSIENCDISATADKVVVFVASGNVTIRKCVIHEGETGFYASGSSCVALVEDNDVRCCYDGVYLDDGARVTVRANRIYDMKHDGLHVCARAGRGFVEENEVWGCAWRDIDHDEKSQTLLRGNKILKVEGLSGPPMTRLESWSVSSAQKRW